MGIAHRLGFSAYKMHSRQRALRGKKQYKVLTIFSEQKIDITIRSLKHSFQSRSGKALRKFFYDLREKIIIHGLPICPHKYRWIC